MEIQLIGKIFTNPLVYIFSIIIFFSFKASLNSRIKIPILIFIYLFSIPLTSNTLLNIWSKVDTIKRNEKYFSAIVLAGGLDYNWHFRQEIENPYKINFDNFTKFKNSEERIFAGIGVVKKGIANNLLHSNWVPKIKHKGEIHNYNVSLKLKKFAVEKGLPKRKFKIYGNKVKRTLDEASELKKFLGKNSTNRLLLITSQSHMRRALAIFQKRGIYVDCLSVEKVDTMINSIQRGKNYIPSVEGLFGMRSFLYEFIGYIGYWLLDDI